MFFAVNKRGIAVTPGNNEHISSKSTGVASARLHTGRNACTARNTLGEAVGAAKLTPVPPTKFKSINKINAEAQAGRKSVIASSSLASHEIYLSDASDADESPRRLLSDVFSATAASSSAPSGTSAAPRGHRLLPLPSSGTDGKTTDSSRRPPKPEGPASELSSRVVAAVRRRVKQGLPRVVAIAHAPASSPRASSSSPPPPPPRTPTERRSGAPTVSTPGGNRRTGSLSRDAVVVAVLLLLTAAAAGSLLRAAVARTPRSAAAWVGLLHHQMPRGVSQPLRTLDMRSAVGDSAALGRSDAGGRVAGGALTYMPGWARIFGGMIRIAGAASAPRTRVVATAFSTAGDRSSGSSGSSSSAMSSGGAVTPQRRWWFGRAASDVGHGGAAFPRLPPPAAGGDAAPGGESPSSPPPPPPTAAAEYEWRESATVRVVTIVHGGGAASPYGTTWEGLADHTAQRLEWTDPSYQMLVFRAQALGADHGLQRAFLGALEGGAHMVVGLDVTDAAVEAFLEDPRVAAKMPAVVLFVGGSEALSRGLTQLQGGLRPQDPESWRTALARRLSWTPDGRGVAVWDTVQLLLGRHDSDNFLFVYLVLINEYVTTVRQVADTTKGFDLQSLICMVKNCGSKVVGCVQDATCKAALDCLQSCTFNDQVCQYRCIVSYESPLLEQFSLCILQLHNCRNLDAKPPLLPDPSPMFSFRGSALTHESAEELFFGWLDEPGQGAPASAILGDRKGKPFSWLVAAGKNPAYDYFPCQHQLYYRGKGRGVVWYEPVFKAITLDGREVWRRRVYRVRRGKAPGTFYLSVLDNGVTSNEFWRILDCDDNLEYCLFYYSGAASAAGLSYSGAVLGTPDGRMPGPQHTERLHAALRRAGIEPWELSYVDNSDCGEAPLRITGPVAPPAPATS